jgi:antitoxin (DNA-binding transcriptional repressor) of toxin-antitoxin stability system
MSSIIGLEEVQTRLAEIIAQLGPQDEVVITAGDLPVARLTPTGAGRASFGSCKGMLTMDSEDDGHLQEFAGYMQ